MTEQSTISLIPGPLASVAWFFSIFSGVYCKFFTNTFKTANNQTFNLNYGIWTYQGFSLVTSREGTVVYETCRSYPDGMNAGAKWKSAMAFSSMTIIIGAFTTVWALSAMCVPASKSAYRMAGMIFMLCCLFQGLTLLFLTSNACEDVQKDILLIGVEPEETCTMSVGAKSAIAATVLWFVASIPALKINVPQLGEVDAVKEKAPVDEKVVDPDSKLFDKDEVADLEENDDGQTLETEAA